MANILFQQHKRRLYTGTSPDGQHRNQIDYILCSQRWRILYSQQKQDWELTVAQIMKSLLPNKYKTSKIYGLLSVFYTSIYEEVSEDAILKKSVFLIIEK